MAQLASLIKQKIEKEIGYEAWARTLVSLEGVANERGEVGMFCVAHENTDTRSASFNTITGLWKCFSSSCGEEGDCIDLYRFVKGLKDNTKAITALAKELGLLKEIDEAVVQQHHRYLFSNPTYVEHIKKTLGVSEATLQRFQIGWQNTQPSRITIPIRGESGLWEDIRLYNPALKPKLCSWAAGHGGVRVYPIEVLPKFKEYILFAGEKDMLRAQDFGIENAITFTGGEKSLPSSFGTLFKGATLYLCYDVDRAGKEGAAHVGKQLARVAEAVYLINLPPENLPDNGDFSDWANLGRTREDWELLKSEAVQIEAGERLIRVGEAPDVEPVTVTFRDLRANAYYNRPIRFLGHALGASQPDSLYQSPSIVQLFCPMDQKFCKKCALYRMDKDERPWRLAINQRTEGALRLLRTTVNGQQQGIRQLFGVYPRCELVQIETVERQAVAHLLISPPIELTQMRESYSGYLHAYYHGEPVTENRDYWFTGYLQADPKDQRAVLNLYDAEPARNAIDHFTVTDEVLEAIDWFKPGNGETISAHLSRLHKIIEEDVGLWGIHQLQQAFLDAIYSVLQFSCGNHFIHNGWNEILIIGDSGLAKTALARRILQMVNVGELISGENVSAAGLIGGVEYIDKMPVSKWGALPRNHRGVIVIDEIDEMQKKNRDIIGQLTALRSSGQAEIEKIVHGKVPAQVRMVWITNPRQGRRIQSFGGACRAIEGVIESRQDIARFTKIYAIADSGTLVETITQNRPTKRDPLVRRHFNHLAILIWSLSADQVKFTEEAVEFLRRETRRLTDKYSDEMPLLEKGRAFDKLAKLSVPIAALCGSFQEGLAGLTLAVDTPHVAYAIGHLEQTYDSEAMGFLAFSEIERDKEHIPNEGAIIQALEEARGPINLAALCRFLLTPAITRRQLEEFLGSKVASEVLWSRLLANNCVSYLKSSEAAGKSNNFVTLLNTLLENEQNCYSERRLSGNVGSSAK